MLVITLCDHICISHGYMVNITYSPYQIFNGAAI